MIVILTGIILIASGLSFHSGAYSIGGFIVGVGLIVVFLGI